MGNFWTKAAKWSRLDKKATDKDWANERNWICNDQSCPNPYTHARGDPCKLTMEDLFPPHLELLTQSSRRTWTEKTIDVPKKIISSYTV